jgi:hypothetical protein
MIIHYDRVISETEKGRILASFLQIPGEKVDNNEK